MNDPISHIQEQRFALLELNSILKHVREQYGNNLPIDILNTIAELAKAYRLKYGSHSGKTNADQEIQNFCVKNGLPLL